MRAIILAAGLGKRMRPLTEHTPKPLLQANQKPLIHYHLEALAKAGFTSVVVNTHWLAEQIQEALGDGSQWGLDIQFSYEPILLETAGGILQALPKLCESIDDIFLVVNGDIYSELDIADWVNTNKDFAPEQLGCLALTENPEHHPEGDFHLAPQGQSLGLKPSPQSRSYTYSGIALFKGRFFASLTPGPQALGPLLREAIKQKTVKGTPTNTIWMDIGTPERLSQLEKHLKSGK